MRPLKGKYIIPKYFGIDINNNFKTIVSGVLQDIIVVSVHNFTDDIDFSSFAKTVNKPVKNLERGSVCIRNYLRDK